MASDDREFFVTLSARIAQLPKAKQCFVSQMLDTVRNQAQR